MAPYTLNFTAWPAGSNPSAFNGSYPNFSNSTAEFGAADNAVPFGMYMVEVTDACGRTATTQYDLQEIEVTPVFSAFPYPGCNSGTSRVEIQVLPYILFTAVITVAPTGYPFPLPHNVTAFINEQGEFVMEPLLTGNYTIELTDTCGNIYDPFNFFVPAMDTNVSATYLPDCTTPGVGTIKLAGIGTTLTSVIMTQAPAAYPQSSSLPYDVSSFISSSGIMSMAGLPAGNYKFDVMDNCGVLNVVTRNVSGYTVGANTLTIIPHCGAFDLQLTHVSNAAAPKFWLQRYNTTTGIWEHPATGVPYVENAVPDSSTALEVSGNGTTLNLTFTGEFRVLKSFESYENGNIGSNKDCLALLHEFEFDGEFEILSIEKVTCDGTLADVRIITDGVPPFIFKIIKKNGVPFVIDNGNNNIFANLEPALYTFTVQHSCGDIIPGEFDVSALPAAVTAHQPGNITICDDISNDGTETYDLTAQTASVLLAQNPAEVTITYHISEADVLTGANAISNLTNYPSSGNQTIFVRVQHNTTTCFDTTSFDLILKPFPVLQMKKEWALCDDSVVTIIADPGFEYLWSTSETTQSITVNEPGIYTVTVIDPLVGGCSATYSIEVYPSSVPEILDIKTIDWTNNDNVIEVLLSNDNIDHFVYSLDGVTYQQENIFTNLVAGNYTVYVKNVNGCGIITYDVYLLSYPLYFTPNADGFNDYWRVNFSEFEPNLKTYIYDRYGKLITGFLPDTNGWDGTLNGQRLPSTDYWFMVIREDGRTLRGHFAMKR
jgi:gliding motility-associated-like protein